ncbi:MAG: N-acetylmuramic acid 6-phosphate etherase [Brachybacterium sp.]|nr:N-acetylmuramic acid 6-phosphate etherase [Brachybacterium sp.]
MTASRTAEQDLGALETEGIDARYSDLDARPVLGVLEAMNDAEADVPRIVRGTLPALARLVEEVAARLEDGGRLLYVGAGTSGRLGVLDAAECPPTFHVDPDLVQAVMAGGKEAVFAAVEGAEDSTELGAEAMTARAIGPRDTVVGIAASGRTPFVLGALAAAREAGALTAAVVCTSGSPVAAAAEHPLEVVVGPEVLTGSTRLKAGSATKQVLNMLSTAVMVRGGKTYGNLMVDVSVTNAKLRARAERLIRTITGADADVARETLVASGDRVKVAVVMIERSVDRAEAEAVLENHRHRLGDVLAPR